MIGNGRGALLGGTIALVLPIMIGIRLFVGGPPSAPDPPDGVAPSSPAEVDAGVLDSLARRARRLAPFRPDGRPSPIGYDPAHLERQMADAGVPKPVLGLTGLSGGSAPLALIQGVPGREGPVLLGIGDTAGGLRVRQIKEGRVTVTGRDTTWVLTLRGAP